MSHDGTGTGWTETDPADAESRSLGAREIRDLRIATRIRTGKEHVTFATSSAGGEHKSGSAKLYYQAGGPSNRPDGSTSLSADDNGRLWIDSDNQRIYHYVHPSWVEVKAGDFVALSIATGDIANDAVDKDKIAADVAGDGLGQNASGALEAKLSSAGGLETSSDEIRIKAGGVTAAMLGTGVGVDKYARVTEEQSSGTAGGDLTTGAAAHSGHSGWNMRGNWTEKDDLDSIITVSGDLIRITAAGTYRVRAKAMANAVLLNRIRLWNNTNDTMLVMGLSCLARSAHDSNSLATLDGQFVTTGAIDVELHHWVSATNEGDGKGVATSSNQGDTEVYAQVELWKVA